MGKGGVRDAGEETLEGLLELHAGQSLNHGAEFRDLIGELADGCRIFIDLSAQVVVFDPAHVDPGARELFAAFGQGKRDCITRATGCYVGNRQRAMACRSL